MRQGQIDRLILNDVTGDLWKYGVLDDVKNLAFNASSILGTLTGSGSSGSGDSSSGNGSSGSGSGSTGDGSSGSGSTGGTTNTTTWWTICAVCWCPPPARFCGASSRAIS